MAMLLLRRMLPTARAHRVRLPLPRLHTARLASSSVAAAAGSARSAGPDTPGRGTRGSPTLAAIESAPCLQCGGAKPSSASRCTVSGLQLTCSQECAETLARAHPALLQQYESIAEDAVFGASDLAKRLFAQVLADGAAQRQPLGARVVDSWESYLELFTTDAQWLGDPRALRLVSAAYSFVMTLSYFLPALRGTVDAPPTDLTLHIVGARAEAMMPRHLWGELAFFHPDVRALDLKLIGDHVPALRSPAKTKQMRAGPQRRHVIEVENIAGLYHDADVMAQLQAPPHAFVLFNPGVGHPYLKDRWRPTIAALLASGKPLLLSSFSKADQDRDVAALAELALATGSPPLTFVVPPQTNPFRSRKFQIDPLQRTAPIQTNAHVMVVQQQAARA